MRTGVLAVIAAAGLLAGCGGSGPKSNGEASKAPAQVLADAKQAAAGASAVHASGSIVSSGTPLTLDLTIARGKGGKGSLTENGLRFDLVRTGDKVYIRGSDAFYKKFAGAAAAQLLHGKWLAGPATTGQFASLGSLTDIDALMGQVTSTSSHGKLVNDGETTYKGQKVVAIRDTSDGGKLYVAATGPAYPVAIVGGKQSELGSVTFDSWNESVSLAPPKDAIDVSQLGSN
jgi:hypothetical protein